MLQVGTEEEPFLKEARITLHGNVRSTELPIYGAKVLGVRKGWLELHGRPIMHTWVHLNETVEAGASQIKVTLNVSDWRKDDYIIVATTNHRHSMGQNEKAQIASIADDGFTINLVEPLKYKHLSLVQTFGDHVVETRGEVGLLTR